MEADNLKMILGVQEPFVRLNGLSFHFGYKMLKHYIRGFEFYLSWYDSTSHWSVYIENIVVKSKQDIDHNEHLRKSFQRMWQHELKLNSLKCSFDFKARNNLGVLVHKRGVEVDKNKTKVIREEVQLKTRKSCNNFLCNWIIFSVLFLLFQGKLKSFRSC